METYTVQGVELSRSEMAMLKTLVVLDDMKAKGIIEGGFVRSTQAGRDAVAQHEAAGFQITDAELKSCIQKLMTVWSPEERKGQP